MYKLISTDLDGTLLNDDSNLPEVNKEYLMKALGKGVKICVNSGRSFKSIKQFEAQLGIVNEGNYGAGFNGALIYESHNHNILSDIRMSNDTAKMVIKALRQYKTNIMVYITDK